MRKGDENIAEVLSFDSENWRKDSETGRGKEGCSGGEEAQTAAPGFGFRILPSSPHFLWCCHEVQYEREA
jgi:hypothetical protein